MDGQSIQLRYKAALAFLLALVCSYSALTADRPKASEVKDWQADNLYTASERCKIYWSETLHDHMRDAGGNIVRECRPWDTVPVEPNGKKVATGEPKRKEPKKKSWFTTLGEIMAAAGEGGQAGLATAGPVQPGAPTGTLADMARGAAGAQCVEGLRKAGLVGDLVGMCTQRARAQQPTEWTCTSDPLGNYVSCWTYSPTGRIIETRCTKPPLGNPVFCESF